MLDIEGVTFSYTPEGDAWLKPQGGAEQRGPDTLFNLRDVTFQVGRGERLGVVGPSGSGKSTLLKIIGGHLRMDGGAVRLDGKDISTLRPGLRDVITVFQDLALFPHMTAYENVEFPLTVGGRMSRIERPAVVEEYMKRFGIWPLRGKKPDDLSGGERQRAALARALIARPSVLLLDEPTASLDLVQKNELALLLNESRDWPVTPAVVIVTHDYEFALSLCDRLAILKSGTVVAVGNTREVVSWPPNAAAAEVLNNHNIIYGTLDGSSTFRSHKGGLSLSFTHDMPTAAVAECALLIRGDVLHLEPRRDQGLVCLDGFVDAVQYRGIYTRVVVNVSGLHLYSDVVAHHDATPLAHRQRVRVGFARDECRLVSIDSTPRTQTAEGGQQREIVYAS